MTNGQDDVPWSKEEVAGGAGSSNNNSGAPPDTHASQFRQMLRQLMTAAAASLPPVLRHVTVQVESPVAGVAPGGNRGIVAGAVAAPAAAGTSTTSQAPRVTLTLTQGLDLPPDVGCDTATLTLEEGQPTVLLSPVLFPADMLHDDQQSGTMRTSGRQQQQAAAAPGATGGVVDDECAGTSAPGAGESQAAGAGGVSTAPPAAYQQQALPQQQLGTAGVQPSSAMWSLPAEADSNTSHVAGYGSRSRLGATGGGGLFTAGGSSQPGAAAASAMMNSDGTDMPLLFGAGPQLSAAQFSAQILGMPQADQQQGRSKRTRQGSTRFL